MPDYVLNLANLTEPYTDEARARTDLAALLLALAFLDEDSGPLPKLRIDRDPWQTTLVLLASGQILTLGEVAMSFYGTTDHDVAAYFDSLIRTIPSDSGLDASLIEAILRLTPKGPAPDLLETFAAISICEMEAALCSVCDFTLARVLTDEHWSHDLMGFSVGPDLYTFDHITTIEHARAVRERRVDRLRNNVRPGTFWTFKDKAFPNLFFGPDVEEQVARVDRTIFPLLIKRLAELDERTAQWKHSDLPHFPDGPTPITGETDQTMKRYGTARRFRGLDGLQHTYEDHMWIDRGNRIHVLRDKAHRSVEVGYIGVHLPTMQHPT